MITWKDRIEEIKAAFGIKNNKQLEERLRLGNGYINDLIGGIKNKNPSKIIVALMKEYKISPVWFFDETVGMFGDKQENVNRRESELIMAIRKVENNNETKFLDIEERLTRLEKRIGKYSPDGDYPTDKVDFKDFVVVAEPTPVYGEEEEYENIPYVEDIAAGPPIAQSEDQTQVMQVPSRLVRKGGQYYAASVRGTSMSEAGIRDGDTVLIRRADVPKDGAIQVVRYKRKSTLKRLKEVEGEGWELHYEDGSGKVIPADSVDYQVQGEFVAVLDGKDVPAPLEKPSRTREEPLKNR